MVFYRNFMERKRKRGDDNRDFSAKKNRLSNPRVSKA